MPVVPAEPAANFAWRRAGRPREWADSPVTVTDTEGNTYNLTVVADANGNPVTPASQDDLLVAMGEVVDRLVDLTEAVVAQGDALQVALLPAEGTAPEDFLLEVAEGTVPDHYAVNKFGRSEAVGTSEDVVWQGATTFGGFVTAPVAIRVRAGGNANDTAAGTGARSVVVEGLDGQGNVFSLTLVTAGNSASGASTQTGIRWYRAYVGDSGVYGAGAITGSNIGNIIIETTGGAAVLSIPAQRGQTSTSVFSVPRGYTAYMRTISWNIAHNQTLTGRLWQRRNILNTAAPFAPPRLVRSIVATSGALAVSHPLEPPLVFPELTDLWATAVTSSGTGTLEIDYDLILVKNSP